LALFILNRNGPVLLIKGEPGRFTYKDTEIISPDKVHLKKLKSKKIW